MKVPLFLVVAFCACTGDWVTNVHGEEEFHPPAVYVEWARELLTCAGRDPAAAGTLVYDTRWFSVVSFDEPDRWGQANYYGGGVIWLLDWAVMLPEKVKHELLHLVFWPERGHEQPEWEKCAPSHKDYRTQRRST